MPIKALSWIARCSVTDAPKIVEGCEAPRSRRLSAARLIGAVIVMATAGATTSCSADQASEVRAVAVEAYRYLHEHPELGKKEFLAQKYIREKLESFGSFRFVESPSAPTAVIAVLNTGAPGRTIALRSEMDARPLESGVVEPTTHDPRSKIDGVMHNCGHDVHAAILLGTAKAVASAPESFAGTIVFLFQPAEETAGGADDVLRDGVLASLGVEKIFALHSAPKLPVGTVSISPGYTLAGSASFTVTIEGRASHAAAPYDGDDIPVVASRLIEAITALPARRLDVANRPTVISVTKIEADSGATNVIPGRAILRGSIRTFENITQPYGRDEPLATLLEKTVVDIGSANRVQARIEIKSGSRPR